ncbi:hypothetical protein BaRGS_00025654 [Batillaria attramentaria]|uniref:Protein kinase domain-containing protein n=1 Tax=Batillaria attramentaria TaxID=370345 RepID=A0ABD0K7N8_9CAEN
MLETQRRHPFSQFVTFQLLAACVVCATSANVLEQNGVCRATVGTNPGDVINLEPLARSDGFPRFVTVFNYSNYPWNYSFNPCIKYDMPYGDPHADSFGDDCHSVAICKYAEQFGRDHYYTLGIHRTAKFKMTVDKKNATTVQLVYKGVRTFRSRETVITLICNETRKRVEDALFVIKKDTYPGALQAELHHLCCCIGGCYNITAGNLQLGSATGNSIQSLPPDGTKKEKDEMMLVIIGTVIALSMLVALIGGLCYIKRTHLQMYSRLPMLNPKAAGQQRVVIKTDMRDYEPSSASKKKLLPVLEDTMIHQDSLDMSQRLGGGIFGDTHLAKWNEMTVAVKRLTLLVHENQITPEAMKLMKNEVWFLSRQRHKNIVTILGLCLDGKLPSIITEYVIGECLKDFIKVQGRLLSWPHRVRICAQVADGMAFLHSTKPPIIHRDLRCGNIFLSDNDLVKVADFGLIKLLQPVREECPQDDCCCRRTMSGCPASIRWTAPELLSHPRVKEGVGKGVDIITTACDVFSFAMVMWELPMCEDPFEELATEAEVIEIVKNGGRPETPPSADMMPQYKELMKMCWEQEPHLRPSFKGIATRMKDLGSHAKSYHKQLQNRQRQQKLEEQNTAV